MLAGLEIASYALSGYSHAWQPDIVQQNLQVLTPVANIDDWVAKWNLLLHVLKDKAGQPVVIHDST